MRKKNFSIVSGVFFLFLLSLFFFNKVFLKGQVPFPGDLLMAEYNPWRTYSYLGYNPGSFPHKAQYFDTLRQIYPWKNLSISLLRKGTLPLWNPYNFSGSPLLANFQSSPFYPLNIFYFILPFKVSWTLLVFLQPLLAGIFTYLFAKEIGLKKFGAMVASIAFSYSGFMSVFLEYNIIGQTVLWLPAGLFFLERLLAKRTFWSSFFFFFALAMPFLAGHLPSAGLSFIFVLAFALFKICFFKKRLRLSLLVFALAFLSLGLSAFQLLPTLELVGQSARIPHDYSFLINKLLIQPKQLAMLLVPDFFGNPATHNYFLNDTYPSKVTYIGLAPLLFALFALFFAFKNRFIRFFALFALVIFALIVSWPLTWLFYKINLPFTSTSSPTNAIFLASFCLAILAGVGADEFLASGWQRKLLILVFPAGIFLFLWLFLLLSLKFPNFSLYPHFGVSFRNLGYSSLIFFIFLTLTFISFLAKKRRRLIGLFLIFLIIFDLFYFFKKFNPFVPKELVFPDNEVFSWLKENAGINRSWGYGLAQVQANFATKYRLFSSQGYDPLYPKRYGEFIGAARQGKLLRGFDSSTRSDADVPSGFGEENLVNNPYRKKILDLLGVKYILDRVENASTEKTFPQEDYQLLWESSGWRVFENKEALPRAFLASSFEIFKNQEEFEKIFFDPSFDPGKKVLLEEKPEEKIEERPLGRAEIISYNPNKVVLETNALGSQLLFLSDTYYPGWQAFISAKGGQASGPDWAKTKIYRANYAFRAVVVPEGEHQVLIEYQPSSFSWGGKISLVSFLLALAVSAKRSLLKRK